MRLDETELTIDYFHRSTSKHLEMIGVDLSRWLRRAEVKTPGTNRWLWCKGFGPYRAPYSGDIHHTSGIKAPYPGVSPMIRSSFRLPIIAGVALPLAIAGASFAQSQFSGPPPSPPGSNGAPPSQPPMSQSQYMSQTLH